MSRKKKNVEQETLEQEAIEVNDIEKPEEPVVNKPEENKPVKENKPVANKTYASKKEVTYSSSKCLTTSKRIFAPIRVSPFSLLRMISFSPIMYGITVWITILLSLPRISNPLSVKDNFMF